MQDAGRVIAIIGGGFCGVALTTRLLRLSAPGTTRIVIVEPRAELGAGVAYATRDYPYPLNVAAGQMSLDGTAPQDFLEFARGQGINATAGDYLPRQVYGEYLRARLAESARSIPEPLRPRHRRARVLQLWRTLGRMGTVARRRQYPACRRRGAGDWQRAARKTGRIRTHRRLGEPHRRPLESR